jgi:nitroreductase/dihydropteridine reductase
MSFIQNLDWRYATKKYDATKKVSDADLAQIMQAIQYTPSAAGAQPYHVVVATGELKDRLIQSSKQVDKLGASHLFVFCTRTDYPARADKQLSITAELQHTTVEALAGLRKTVDAATTKPENELKPWAARQAYIALGFALASCTELKIDSSPMEGFNPTEFSTILELPEYMQPVVIMAIGYRDPEDTAQPSKRAKFRFSETDLFDRRS